MFYTYSSLLSLIEVVLFKNEENHILFFGSIVFFYFPFSTVFEVGMHTSNNMYNDIFLF